MKNRPADMQPYESLSFSEEETFRLVFHNLEDTLLLVSRDLRIISLNESSRKKIKTYFGITVTPETTVLDIVPPERRGELVKIYEAVFAGEEKRTETRVSTDTTIIYFENYFKPARNEHGEILAALVITKDVTSNKKAEIILKEIEERWRFALEGSNQGVWDWNMQSGEVFYSDAYKKLYGYQANELESRIEDWQSRIHPEDRERMSNAIRQHIAGPDASFESTYRIKAKNGNYKWVLARGMIIERDAGGKPQRMIGTHTDITKQVTVEQTYKVLFYSNPLPMWTYDLDTLAFVTVNNAAIQQYGYSKEEFLSMSISDIRPAEDLESFTELIQKRKNLGHLKTVHRHVKKNGEIIFVEVSTHALENSDSNTVLVVAHDITSKIRAEEELRKSNERFLLASKATSEAIYDWDLVSNEIYWSEGLHTLFGFHPKEVPISLWDSLIHPDDRQRISDSLAAAIKDPGKKFWKEEYRFANKNGSFSHVLDRGFIVRDKDQNPLRMIGSMQDITERKYAEQILSLERTVFELSNKPGTDFRFVVETLLKGIEEIHADAHTSLLLLKDDGSVESFAAPRLPAEFSEKLNGVHLGPQDGSCGAAMHLKETVIVENIETHPLWARYKSLALQHNLRASWSLPVIHSSGRVIGSFAVYYTKVNKPTTTELNTLERTRNILRILLEHHQSVDEIKRANERFDIVMKATHDLIWDWNLESNKIYRDRWGLEKVFGIDDNSVIEESEHALARIHPDDRERVQKLITEILQAKADEVFEVEYRFKKNDGTYSHVYDRGLIIRNEEGKPVRMIGAAQNITERKHLEQELLRNELEKQKAINQATVDSQEQERTEIGKELHDNVNQVLTTTKLYLELALGNAELKDELIEKSNKNILSVINEIRQLSRSLMDPSIGDLGLIDSIHDLVENVNLTRKLQVSLKADGKLESFLDKNHKLTIFRIIQEALNNTIKYAQAKTLLIGFQRTGEQAQLVIQDDGMGFDPLLVKKGAGLKNIQNRVYLINGTFTIQTAPGKGCKIIINFPINNMNF